MRTFLIILPLLLLAGAGGYGYVRNPAGCTKLCADLKTDLVAIYVPVPTPVATPPPATPAAPAATNVVNTSPAQPAPSVTAAIPAPASAPVPAPSPPPPTEPTPVAPPTPAAWSPPKVIPAEPDWTWTTPDKIYQQVKIIRIEADRVTISHSGGVAVIPTWTLPSDITAKLNYDPDAANVASTQRPKDAPAPDEMVPQILNPQGGPQFQETTDYARALVMAKASRRLVLLHFTGSDWCYYCKMLEQEVMSTPDFRQFAANNYILVTLDFPRTFPLPQNVQQQNDSLAQKYHVGGYPTLVVIDSDEKELGRHSGYDPGTGPGPVISGLKSFMR